MGGGNPIKKLVKNVTDVVSLPARIAAEAVGADGIRSGIDNLRREGQEAATSVIDVTSGKASEQKKAAKAAAAKAAMDAQAEQEEQARQARAAETARVEGERMRAGLGARTLLTGPQGLDEEESITRRTLAGF